MAAGVDEGTTSAHAENTTTGGRSSTRRWNYLRARGEYQKGKIMPITQQELPPRTRRILLVEIYCDIVTGTTSACAENTHLLW